MLCWGKADDGALGIGTVTGTTVTQPTRNQYVWDTQMVTVACGHTHTLFLLEDGTVLSCGRNGCGQLGHNDACMRPIQCHIVLEEEKVTSVHCGAVHSVALGTQGAIVTWGDNKHGQLGRGEVAESEWVVPRPIKLKVHIVQIACGSRHTLALGQDSHVYTWGHNTHHQLGHTPSSSHISSPTSVRSLEWLPISLVSAGGEHSFAVTVTGRVYGWGKNSDGQVGVGSVVDITTPTILSSLSSQVVKAVVCGDNHTAVLTEDGGVFSFGSNHHGQLGHSSSSPQCIVPTKVFELMGSDVSQIACGRNHTLAVVRSSGKVYSFGRGDSGQLGTGGPSTHKIPVPVAGEWLPPSSLPELGDRREDDEVEDMEVDCVGVVTSEQWVVRRIFAGGDQSFATLAVPTVHSAEAVVDMRSQRLPQPCFLHYTFVKYMLDYVVIGFATLNEGGLSHLKKATSGLFIQVFSSASILNGSFIKGTLTGPLEQYCDVDLDDAIRTFKFVNWRLGERITEDCFIDSFTRDAPSCPPNVPEGLRFIMLILHHPVLDKFPNNLVLLTHFFDFFSTLLSNAKEIIGNWLFNGPMDKLSSVLLRIKSAISCVLDAGSKKMAKERNPSQQGGVNIALPPNQLKVLQGGLDFMKWMHQLNLALSEPLEHTLFHITELAQHINITDDYIHYRQRRTDRIIFVHYPFIMNAAMKSQLLSVDGKFRMTEAIATAYHQNATSWFAGQQYQDHSPNALVLTVRRTHLLQDTISLLPRHTPTDYKKPLQVVFHGEEGMDDGGIRKEFFMLLIRELLNPIFGMFYRDEESHLLWFKDQATILEEADTRHIHLIGLICGLAAYNDVIVDLPFPLVLYKKLLGRKPSLPDLEELKPSVGRHLSAILKCNQEQFNESYHDLTFSVVRHHYGSMITVPLITGGEEVVVTWQRRAEYVLEYLRYELTDSMQTSYKAFADGFKLVFSGLLFDSLHPKELASLMVGSLSYPFEEFEKHTRYENGYSVTHPAIRMFWSVFNQFSDDTKKKFLVFWTGSNRIPVTGIRGMNLIIQRMDGGPRCHRLPVAHTCYNVLDLPPYPSLELMKEKLLQAINFTEGFGIV